MYNVCRAFSESKKPILSKKVLNLKILLQEDFDHFTMESSVQHSSMATEEIVNMADLDKVRYHISYCPSDGEQWTAQQHGH